MKKLDIAPTKSTPGVEYKDQVFRLYGQSYPENAMQFYKPVFVWLQEALEDVEGSVHFEFSLDYMNTSSSKCVMDMIDILDAAYIKGKDIAIDWYYDMDNDSLLECAQEFQEDVRIPFNIIAREG